MTDCTFEAVWKEVSQFAQFKKLYKYQQRLFRQRLEVAWPDIMRPLTLLYGRRTDLATHLCRFVLIVLDAFASRSADLHDLDHKRLLEPDWYQSAEQVGYIAYADRFADDLADVANKIPYLKELGVTYLHLMPLLQPQDGENDGGYAVANYRQTDSRLGTIQDLANLTALLRQSGISLCTDLVCNHTATDHAWAQKALAGDPLYQDYYWMFADRSEPDEFEKNLRPVFPEQKLSSFLYHEAIDRWVWTTFHPYQWDLNYSNPTVFGEMLDIMLYLANQGVEILRMDAVAFMWKQKGTPCENLPEAHALLQAWRALTRVAAPALILKAEAIVAPEDVVPYFGTHEWANKECELAYHNSFMVLLWSALAERNVTLLTHSLQRLPAIPNQAAWVNYVRCHDDIGWAITDENAAGIGLNGYLHRAFLSDFYSGEFEGSFARGMVFQHNPLNNDRRINGSAASLAGLERAIELEDAHEVDLAIGRILLIYSMMLAYGGIPLIYMGDELGLLNDYNYIHDEAHRDDSRWLHRPKMSWGFAAARDEPNAIPHRIFSALQNMLKKRKSLHALHANAANEPVWVHNDHVFGLLRHSPRGCILALGNFSEHGQVVSAERLNHCGMAGSLIDHLSGRQRPSWADVYLRPYESVWLEKCA